MVQLLTPTPTSRATLHIATDGRTDRRQHRAKSRSDCTIN